MNRNYRPFWDIFRYNSTLGDTLHVGPIILSILGVTKDTQKQKSLGGFRGACPPDLKKTNGGVRGGLSPLPLGRVP